MQNLHTFQWQPGPGCRCESREVTWVPRGRLWCGTPADTCDPDLQTNNMKKVNSQHCKTSNIRCTKSQTFNTSCLVLQLSLPNLFKPGVKLIMKMQLEQRRQTMLQLHLSDQQFYCLLRCALYQRLYSNSKEKASLLISLTIIFVIIEKILELLMEDLKVFFYEDFLADPC